jgi:hypothetical protein
MANAVTSHTILDGPRKLVMLFTGILDTSNEARVVKVDASTFDPAPTKIRIDKIDYSVSGTLKVVLDWDATTDVVFAALAGQGSICAEKIGGLQNNAGTGVTGDIALTTVGYASGTETYTLLVEMTKGSF